MRTFLILIAASLSVLSGCESDSTPSASTDKPATASNAKPDAAEPDAAKPDASKKPDAHSEDDGHGHGKSEADMSPEELEAAKVEARKAITEFQKQYATLHADDLEVFAWDGVKGSKTPKITVIEFADFDCPHCKLAAFYTQDLVHRYGDNVQFVFKNYPLGKDCNDSLTNDVHPNSCRAAVGTVCAGRQGKFWQQHDGTFAKQGSLSKRTIKSIAKDIGLDMDRFNDCLEAAAPWDDVKTQVLQGRSLGLTGTPAFYVNGKALPSPHPLMIEAAMRVELKALGVTELPEDKDSLFGDS
jgi:protein-disulfide isomerase